MTLEVHSPETGRLRITHARRAAGRPLTLGDEVDGIVIGPAGIARARIRLVPKPSGRGAHLVFRCPACEAPRAILMPTREGALACATCTIHRTRHQRESSTKAWEEYALDLEDRLFRGVLRRGYTSSRLAQLRRLASEIDAGDADRFAAVLPLVVDALRAVDAPAEREGDGALRYVLEAGFIVGATSRF